jgi:hypothetical protein
MSHCPVDGKDDLGSREKLKSSFVKSETKQPSSLESSGYVPPDTGIQPYHLEQGLHEELKVLYSTTEADEPMAVPKNIQGSKNVGSII